MSECDATPWFVMPPTEADSTKEECLVRNNMRIIAKVSVPSDTGPYQGRSYSERLETALTNARLIAAAPELLEALEHIRQYGSDTLSGRADGPDDREWQREGVRDMTRIAHQALAKVLGEEADG